LAADLTTERSEFKSRHCQDFPLLHIVRTGSEVHSTDLEADLVSSYMGRIVKRIYIYICSKFDDLGTCRTIRVQFTTVARIYMALKWDFSVIGHSPLYKVVAMCMAFSTFSHTPHDVILSTEAVPVYGYVLRVAESDRRCASV
jgi:hypothetical protein